MISAMIPGLIDVVIQGNNNHLRVAVKQVNKRYFSWVKSIFHFYGNLLLQMDFIQC